MRADLRSTIRARYAVAPGTISTAVVDGTAIDTQGFDSLTFLFSFGTMGGTASVVPTLTAGTAAGTASLNVGTVGASDLIGSPTAVGTVQAGTPSVQRIGYNGNFRYVRPSFVHSGTANMSAACIAVLGHPHVEPPTS